MIISGIMGSIIMIITIGIIILVISFIVKSIKGYEKRANEKIIIERKNILTLQKKIDEQDKRLINIEEILKEVE